MVQDFGCLVMVMVASPFHDCEYPNDAAAQFDAHEVLLSPLFEDFDSAPHLVILNYLFFSFLSCRWLLE